MMSARAPALRALFIVTVYFHSNESRFASGGQVWIRRRPKHTKERTAREVGAAQERPLLLLPPSERRAPARPSLTNKVPTRPMVVMMVDEQKELEDLMGFGGFGFDIDEPVLFFFR